MRLHDIVIAMRPSLSLVLVAVLAACPSKSQDSAKSNQAPAPTPPPPPPQVKRPVDTKPLPTLAADPGGASGNVMWAAGFGGLGIEVVRDVAVAPGGEVYAVGYFDGEAKVGATTLRAAGDLNAKKPTSDGYIVKVGADGKLAWAKQLGAARDDVANGIAVRGDRMVVVGAFLDQLKLGELDHKATGSDDMFVVALDKDGEAMWMWHGGGVDSDGANAVAATPDGGWVVGGSFSSDATFTETTLKSRGGTDAVLIKFKASGDIEWVKQFGGRYNDTIRYLGVDGQGSIYVEGQFRDTADWGGKPLTAGGAANDIVLAKYDLNGDHLWSKRFGDALEEAAGGLAVDPAGNVTITGSFDKSISFGDQDDHAALGESDIFVARFTSSGKLEWAHTYGSEREDAGSGVAADGAGNTVLSGWFQNKIDFGKGLVTSKGNKDVFVLKLDPKGGVVWAQTWGSKDHDQGRAVAIDDKGAAYVAGLFRFALPVTTPPLESVRAEADRIPKPDTFVVKLDR